MLTTHSKLPADLAGADFGARKLYCEKCDEKLPLEEYVNGSLLSGLPDLTAPAAAAVREQYVRILSGAPGFAVRHVSGWTFPDEEYFPAPYFVFSSGGRDFGVARISHGRLAEPGSPGNTAPFCMIETIQGVKGVNSLELPLNAPACQTMLRHLLAACASLLRTGWQVALLSSKCNRRLVNPFFRKETVASEHYQPTTFGHARGLRQFHLLAAPHKNRAVRELLGFARRERIPAGGRGI